VTTDVLCALPASDVYNPCICRVLIFWSLALTFDFAQHLQQAWRSYNYTFNSCRASQSWNRSKVKVKERGRGGGWRRRRRRRRRRRKASMPCHSSTLCRNTSPSLLKPIRRMQSRSPNGPHCRTRAITCSSVTHPRGSAEPPLTRCRPCQKHETLPSVRTPSRTAIAASSSAEIRQSQSYHCLDQKHIKHKSNFIYLLY